LALGNANSISTPLRFQLSTHHLALVLATLMAIQILLLHLLGERIANRAGRSAG
jgi:hypothetical protein